MNSLYIIYYYNHRLIILLRTYFNCSITNHVFYKKKKKIRDIITSW